MAAIYVLAFCYTCRRMIMCNPRHVPSLPANLTTTSQKEPVCRACIERANPVRLKNGLPPIEIHPMAYEPQEEDPEPSP